MASIWHKLAAIGGATAVGLGAYGSHGLSHLQPTYREVFDTANKYHILHGGLLMAIVPFTRCVAAGIAPGGRAKGTLQALQGGGVSPGRERLQEGIHADAPSPARRRPHIVGSLTLVGTLLFSGRCVRVRACAPLGMAMMGKSMRTCQGPHGCGSGS